MNSREWKRGAKGTFVFAAFKFCCTNRPRIRSASKSVGNNGMPFASRRWISEICTTRGSRLKSSRASSCFSCLSTSCLDGGFALSDASGAVPRTSTNSLRNLSISGKDSTKYRLRSTTPEWCPKLRRRSTTSSSLRTVAFSDVCVSSFSACSWAWPVSLSTEKVLRVCSATSKVKASSPHLMKCQYFLELNASVKMFPAISLSILRALSKPKVMGISFGTYTLQFLL
mmetsp:Transcript_43118/g.108381  ORF Transcript_43118/g.108381 Transcript_43118/m.108381 type:complete len:227 (+) Transcript_43118:1091-1771(+)